MAKRIPVIIDCDPGYDDAVALLVAAGSGRFEILAVTAVAGNGSIESTYYNAARVMAFLGLDVPLGKGRPGPLLGKLVTSAEVHGRSAMDGVDLPEPRLLRPTRSAFQLFVETLERSSDRVLVVATGPLTNLAVVLLARPDVADKIERIVWMGGAFGEGNITPSAEFNAFVDPEACQVVLDSGVPVTMVGLDVTHKALVYPDRFDELEALGKAGRLAAQIMRRYWVAYERRGFRGLPIHDATAAVAAFEPGIIKTRKARVDVELRGSETRGRTVVDFSGKTGREPNCDVAVEIDSEKFLEIMFTSIRNAGSN